MRVPRVYLRPRRTRWRKPTAAWSLVGASALVFIACGEPSDQALEDCDGGTCSAGTGSNTGIGGSSLGASGGMPGTGGTGAGVGGTGTTTTGGSGSGNPLSTEVVIEEGETGHCDVDGIVEATHAGFTGTGYLNTDNLVGAGIEWALEVGEAGTYTLEIAYANEPAEDRPGDVVVNGEAVASDVSFPSTTSWTTWSTTELEVTLAAGENRIVLLAAQATGLANIDSLKVTGAAVGAFDCNGAMGTGGAPGTGGAGSGGAGTGGGGTGGSGTGGSGTDDLCDVGVWDGNPPEILDLTGALGTHDPAIIEAGGIFYRFDTGLRVPAYTSTNLTHWTSAGNVYSSGAYPPAWLADFRDDHNWDSGDNQDPWAPDVAYFGGKYHLYSSNSLFFGDNISCISHLTKTNIASGSWVDEGPVVCTNGSENYNAIDPEVELDEDGTPWLAFGSFWSQAIQAIQLDQNGNRVGTSYHHLAHASSIEGPTLVRRCGYYYLFVTHGLCCPNTTEPARNINAIDYRTVVGRSQNILGPYVDKNGVALTAGGGTIMVQGENTSGINSPYAAAGHGDVFVSGNMFYHAYHAYPYSRNPYAELRIVEMPFDDEGWPVPAPGP